MDINKDKLDFTAKNIPEIVRRLEEGTISDDELSEAARRTSEIVGMEVKWMGFPFEFYKDEKTVYKQTNMEGLMVDSKQRLG